jgi:hypothetical protein
MVVIVIISMPTIPFSKGGQRRFRRYPQAAGRRNRFRRLVLLGDGYFMYINNLRQWPTHSGETFTGTL